MLTRFSRKCGRQLIAFKANDNYVQPIRQFWVPIMIAGAAVVVGSTLVKYINQSAAKSAAKTQTVHSTMESVEELKAAVARDQVENEQVAEKNLPVMANFKLVSIPENVVGVDVGTSFSKLVINSWDYTQTSLINIADLESTFSVVENGEGRRLTPTALHISSESDEIVIGHFAKVKRFNKSNSTMYGLHRDHDRTQLNKFAAECQRVLPLYYRNIPDSLLSQYSASTLLSAMMVSNMVTTVQLKLRLDEQHTNNRMLKIHVAVANNKTHKEIQSMLQLSHHLIPTFPTMSTMISTVPDSICAVLGAQTLGLISTNVEFPKTPRTIASVSVNVPVIRENDYVLVIDVGGKTTQLSILQWHQEHLSLEWSNPQEAGAVCTSGRPSRIIERTLQHSGCDTIDELLVNELTMLFARQTGIDLLQDPMAKQRIFDAVETARTELCTRSESLISLPFITADASGPKHPNHTVSRLQLDKICEKLLRSVHREIDELLIDFSTLQRTVNAGAAREQQGGLPHHSEFIDSPSTAPEINSCPVIHSVILTGGGLRIPCVSNDLKAMLNAKVTQWNVEHLNTVVGAKANASLAPPHIIIPDYPEELVGIGASSVVEEL